MVVKTLNYYQDGISCYSSFHAKAKKVFISFTIMKFWYVIVPKKRKDMLFLFDISFVLLFMYLFMQLQKKSVYYFT